jgi:hypothetical protein
MKAKRPLNPEKSFGVSVGAVLIAIGVALWWRGRPLRAEILGGVGSVLLLAGLVYAPVLKYPSAAWWRFSRVLGHVNARILLTVFFVVVFMPVSAVWRLTGKDPLARRRSSWRGWTPYPPRYRDPKHAQRMF